MRLVATLLLLFISFHAAAADNPLANCGVGEPGAHPASDCANVDEATTMTASCSGRGLIACVANKNISEGGLNASADCLEVYCLNGETRVCLSGEKCPWRNDDNMKAKGYPKGLQTEHVPGNAQEMTCSPFGLELKADAAEPVKMASAKDTDAAPFTALECDAKGKLKTLGGVSSPHAGKSKIPKFGEICGSKPGKCKAGADGGTICGPNVKQTYLSYEDMTRHNALYEYAGPCR